jgi:hypothetical protein
MAQKLVGIKLKYPGHLEGTEFDLPYFELDAPVGYRFVGVLDNKGSIYAFFIVEASPAEPEHAASRSEAPATPGNFLA